MAEMNVKDPRTSMILGTPDFAFRGQDEGPPVAIAGAVLPRPEGDGVQEELEAQQKKASK